MRQQWLTGGIFAVALSLTGVGAYAQGTTAPRGQHPQSASSASGQQVDLQSQQFVQKMLMANMAEIKLGQMAADRAMSPEVKSFAQTMVTDHTQANQELLPLAQQLGVKEPKALDAKHRALSNKLGRLRGAEFDRQYMKAMVDGHQEVVREVRPIAGRAAAMAGSGSSATGSTGTAGTTGTTGTTGGTGTASAQGYAAKTLPIVQHHLQQAQQIEQSIGK
jgi:putative membrane protein